MHEDRDQEIRQATYYWIDSVKECVQAGGPRLSCEMTLGNNAKPTAYHWFLIAEAIFKYSNKQDRLRMMRVFLAHPDLPPQMNENTDLVRAAILNRAHECVPLLHEKGFRLQDPTNSEMITFMGREIFKGRWPHPDLVMPSILGHPHTSIQLQIIKGVLRECSNQGKRITQGISRLDANEEFNQLLSKIIGRRAENIIVRRDNYEAAAAPLFYLYTHGILDLDIARQEAIEKSPAQTIHPILTQLEKMVISSRALGAQTNRPGRRL